MATQFCTFKLDDLNFGIDVMHVQEIMRGQAVTRVPLAPSIIRGLINLRGQIVTVIDLRRRLGLPDRVDDEPAVNIVVRTDDGAVSLVVDEIGDVLPVSPELFELPPPTLSGAARELIRGTYKLQGTLLLVLDVERAVAISPIRSYERTGSSH